MAEKEIDYIDENDPALKAVDSEKSTALEDSNRLYDDAVSANDKAIDAMITQSNAAAKEAERVQQEQTDFTIDKIEQQKAQAEKDYTKEQSASYVDWQKQSGQYGANAEAMAAKGMSGTGYSETAQVSMYNTYQNRVAVAKASFDKITLEYNNGIREAKLANSSALAKIKADALAAQLELTLQGLQYKNSMLTQKANTALTIEQTFNQKYMDVYDQLYKEATLKENARQFDETMKLQEGLTIDKDGDAIDPTTQGGSGSRGDGPIKKPELVTDAPTKSTTQADAEKFDTFSNGYQPKGISGHGFLSKTGQTIPVDGSETKTGKAQNQNVWKAEDGTYWYWSGKEMKYIQIPSVSSSSKKQDENSSFDPRKGASQVIKNKNIISVTDILRGSSAASRKGWI